MYQLRPYQKESVHAVIRYFQKERKPAVLVLPTGAGKSLVIAELAKIAKGRVLVLTHVKELVEQNHGKYESYGLKAGIYAAGLNRKEILDKVIFGSIQSVARASEEFFKSFSLLIVDECHRISDNNDSQYLKVITKLRTINPQMCVLGLTATPYRLGMGWIYEFNQKGYLKSQEARFFKKCIYDLPLSYMIKSKYLTLPVKVDAPVACYDFSSLRLKNGADQYSAADIQKVLSSQERVTPGIISHIVDMAKDRQGVMIFTSAVNHAKEILKLLPEGISDIVVGDTQQSDRDRIIQRFKAKEIKFLVNVSVLTTGFDAPHVDLIALLRPTESVSLFQQIVGRGLRLSPGKKDCLILDYTGTEFDLFDPEIGETKPSEDSEVVLVPCPECGYENEFWGKKDPNGSVIEHYGRKCKGAHEDPVTLEVEACGYRFRFKVCEACGAENDIAARSCHKCQQVIVDADQKLKDAMELKDAHVMRPDSMMFERSLDKKKRQRLEISYYDYDANALKEYYYFQNQGQIRAFYYNFVRTHTKTPGREIPIRSIDDVLRNQDHFRLPEFVIARKKKYFWDIREKIFAGETRR